MLTTVITVPQTENGNENFDNLFLNHIKPQVIYNPIHYGNGGFVNVYLLALDNTIRGNHCRRPIVVMGVVDHLGLSFVSTYLQNPEE